MSKLDSTQPRGTEVVPTAVPPVLTPQVAVPPVVALAREVGSGRYVPTRRERGVAAVMHGVLLAGLFPVTLVLWLVERRRSGYLEHHGKQAMSFVIAEYIAWILVISTWEMGVGCFLIPVAVVLHLVVPTTAAIGAWRGRWVKIPVVGGIMP